MVFRSALPAFKVRPKDNRGSRANPGSIIDNYLAFYRPENRKITPPSPDPTDGCGGWPGDLNRIDYLGGGELGWRK